MPLYKKMPFALVEKPEDLKPQEHVFQIRFTKEIFRSYNEYLKRINLYRKNFWTCKATGKSNLTYEEALLSEEKASKRIQSIPVEYMAPVLRHVQFSMLNLKDLVDSVASRFRGPFSEGAEVYGRKDSQVNACKIIRVIDDADETQYEIAWLDDNNEISGKTLVHGDDLTGKIPPFSKRLLKSFIKDSTYRSLPWVLHDDLAKKHGITTAPPTDLTVTISIENGLVVCSKKRKKPVDLRNPKESSLKELKVYIRKNKKESEPSTAGINVNGDNKNHDAQTIKYPIDDLLVRSTEEDQLLTERPSACRDFNVPLDCVGDLLMVWDFCASYGRLLNLSPFSLEDFENSICFRDSTPMLIVESYSTLFRLLGDDESGKFFTEVKKRKPKITHITWTEYLCDFMETNCTLQLSRHVSTIRRGHYGLLDVGVKLEIFRQLVGHALETDTVREKLDEYVEERQALAATRRDDALVEGRKRREEKERKNGKEIKEDGGMANGVVSEKKKKKVVSQSNNSSDHDQTHSSRNSETERGDSPSKKNAKRQKIETVTSLEECNHPSKRDIHKLMKNEIKESIEMKSLEQRKEFLEREIEKRVIRTSPLGKDRNHCRYWYFRRDGRVFVESSDSKKWGYYQTKEQLDDLIGSLNTKGVRERALKKQLQKMYNKICSGLEKRLKDDVETIEMEDALVRRSTRVRAPVRENPAIAFLKYENKWKEV